MSIVKLTNISKSFNEIPLFTNINLSIEKGRTYGIRGYNGSGKSVLLKLICGFIKPDSGDVYIDKQYKDKKDDFPEKFGIIIDRPGYIANKTGFENLKTLASIRDTITDHDIYKAMEIVGLNPHIKQKMKNYSLGMKQKIAIAQTFMENQEVLILDEPFNALDFDSIQNMRQLLLKFKKEGKTIIITSHNQEDLDILCDEQFQINNSTLQKIE